ncbi:hypothetical protein BDY19DRAFT_930073 [Irpex rosettiformis]|uniref:Uncharacterized protein n=1 Tax=Irpex rosettiformis TaxID=378272 RepID=A0ACB8UB26_9APHY|nr:hypothetical protein BDY19DRAFT_930073 [Irpex rosettiformis]
MNPLEPNSPLKNAKMTAKIYWPEEARQAEDELLDYAYAVASQSEHVRGHLPRLITSGSFRTRDDPIAKRKDLLELGEESKFIQRCLRILVFYKLKPIHELKEDEFIIAWTDCFRCHFQLWMKHLHHCDISSDNLMYDRDEEGRVVGVLNDFDLSILAPLADKFRTGCMGTVPFMATVLMRPGGTALPHLFEYDVESFIYVLLWITRRYGVVDGNVKLVDQDTFVDWLHDNASTHIQAHQQALEDASDHAAILQKESNAALAEAHAKHEETIVDLCRILGTHILDRLKENMASKEVMKMDRTAETHIQQLHEKFMKIIKENQVLKDAEGRQLDLSETQWDTLVVRGLASYLWRELHSENSNAAAQ